MDSLETMLAKAQSARACDASLNRIRELRSIEAVKAHSRAPYWAYWYAFHVLKGPWPEGEESIQKEPCWAFWYARDILKGPWPEGEECIRKHPEWACVYARDVLNMSEGDAKAWADAST